MAYNKKRFWEIDFLRGIAIIMMITYHIFFDLNFFDVYNINLYSLELRLFLYPIGTIFFLLVGISLSLSNSFHKKILSKKNLIYKFIRRGIWIFSLGLVITIVTFLFLEKGFVVFGVLHCIGISIIISILFLNTKKITLTFGIVLIIMGVILRFFTFDFNWFFWLGFIPSDFHSLDYFPLLPWFGVALIGIFIGNIFYPEHKRSFKINDISVYRPIKFLCFLGRHSLLIYFLHQPIIVGIIFLIS